MDQMWVKSYKNVKNVKNKKLNKKKKEWEKKLFKHSANVTFATTPKPHSYIFLKFCYRC